MDYIEVPLWVIVGYYVFKVEKDKRFITFFFNAKKQKNQYTTLIVNKETKTKNNKLCKQTNFSWYINKHLKSFIWETIKPEGNLIWIKYELIKHVFVCVLKYAWLFN